MLRSSRIKQENDLRVIQKYENYFNYMNNHVTQLNLRDWSCNHELWIIQYADNAAHNRHYEQQSYKYVSDAGIAGTVSIRTTWQL